MFHTIKLILVEKAVHTYVKYLKTYFFYLKNILD